MYVNPSRDPYEAERREQTLVLAYKAFLERQGHDVCRPKIVPAGEAKPLFCDLYDKTTRTLIEAKGSVQGGAIRMAIGQLADYRRFVDGGADALMVPAISGVQSRKSSPLAPACIRPTSQMSRVAREIPVG